jgi:PAS domain S-box-containing protein
MTTLAYLINNARIQNNNYLTINNTIQNLMLLNKDFNLYLKNSFEYNNFDIIQSKIALSKIELNKLKNNTILLAIENKTLQKDFKELQKDIEKKYEIINRTKSYRAILNKSYVIAQKINKNGIDEKLNNLYATIMTVDKNPEINIQKELDYVNKIQKKYTKSNDIFFLKHSKIIFEYHLKLEKSNKLLTVLPVESELKKFNVLYSQYASSVIQTAYLSIIVLFISLIFSILFYLIYDYKLSLFQKELSRFRKTVEDSDNIVIITDFNANIKYVNAAFTRTTGYKAQEVMGKNPRILNSGRQPDEFYKDLKDTIYAGKKWSGQFININKQKELSFENATISPVFDENDNIVEFIAIKSDITKETLGQEQLLKKEKLLLQQSKMAAMGEMLQNIAHQWRQPLSIISTASTGLLVKRELNLPTTKDEDIATLNTINDTTQYLSETINAFRDFFQTHKEKVNFNVKDIYQKTLNIVQSKFKSINIELVENIDDVSITNFDNELIQVLMNILNNSRDALEISKNKKKFIFVDIYIKKNNLFINIKDNAGGIPENIIDKVFEPYFTTKHKSQGTGIGLYMCQEIIKNHMQGKITVSNQSFTYEDIPYKGPEFKIILPINETLQRNPIN